MTDTVDVYALLRRANPVPTGRGDHDVPTSSELWARTGGSSRSSSQRRPGKGERAPMGRGPGWAKVAASAAALAAGVTVLAILPDPDDRVVAAPASTIEPITVPPPPPVDLLVGFWVSTDTDNSTQTMEVWTDTTGYSMVVYDDSARVCSGVPSTMEGSGRREPDGSLVIPRPYYTCDDGSTPTIPDGPSVEEQLADLTFTYDEVIDQLSDSLGVVWHRAADEGSDTSEPPPPPATTPPATTTPSATTPPPTTQPSTTDAASGPDL